MVYVLDVSAHSLVAETIAGYDVDCQRPDVDRVLWRWSGPHRTALALAPMTTPLLSAHTFLSTWSLQRMHAVRGSTVGKRPMMLSSEQQDR